MKQSSSVINISWKNLFHNRGVFLYMSALLVTCLVTLYSGLIVFKAMVGSHLREDINYACQTFNGRLGNHIYQYAAVFGISKLNNLTIILGKDDDLVKFFQVPSAEILNNRRVCDSFVEKNAKHCCVFDETFMTLPPKRNYKLGVYLQSWKYFGHAFDSVRAELRFKAHIQKSAKTIVENFRKAYSMKYERNLIVVGVHIRRGDIASRNFALGGVALVPDSYVRNAVDYILDKFDHVVFIVCSDGMDHAIEVMDYRNVSAEFVHNSAIEDLAMLANCDHVITTSGTFGWWAGFLSGGVVLYYKYPMTEGTFERTEYNYDDFFLPDWIGLGD